MRRPPALFLTLVLTFGSVAAGCGGSEAPSTPTAPTNPNPQPNPNPTPPPTTSIVWDGVVTETVPTTDVPVLGASLRIVDGANAGRTAGSDGNGYFVFDGITPGTFNVDVQAQGYESRIANVTRTASGRLNVQLQPAAREVSQTINETVSGGDPACGSSSFQRACKVYRFGVHHFGTANIELRWTSSDNDLDIYLYQGTREVASNTDINNFRDRNQVAILSSSVSAGQTYEVRVAYFSGSTVQPFTLTIRRPI